MNSTNIEEKYVGYVRVSTQKQLKGKSIEIQKEAIKQYCKAHEYKFHKFYIDRGLSAYKKRPQFEAMMEYLLKRHELKGVIVHDLTRFGRSTSDLLYHINRIDAKGKKFISIKDNIDISTKTGRLILTLLAAIADYEKETIMERLTAGKEYAKVHGTKSGKPMNRPLAVIDWDKVKELRGYGLSWRKTSKQVGVSCTTLIKRAREEGYYE